MPGATDIQWLNRTHQQQPNAESKLVTIDGDQKIVIVATRNIRRGEVCMRDITTVIIGELTLTIGNNVRLHVRAGRQRQGPVLVRRR